MVSLLLACLIGTVVGAQTVRSQIVSATLPTNCSAVVAAKRLDLLWYQQEHEMRIRKVVQGGWKMVLLGDSITVAWNARYRQAWKQYKVLNLGCSGDRTEQILWRIANGEIDGLSPKLLILLIGTNNTTQRNPPNQIAAGIRAIVDVLRVRLPDTRIIILSLLPRGLTPSDFARINNQQTNEIIKNFADDKMVFFVDATTDFILPDGTLADCYGKDKLHLNSNGYKILLDKVGPLVDRIMQLPACELRVEDATPAIIRRCEAMVSDTDQQEIKRRLDEWRQALDTHRTALEKIGCAAEFAAVSDEASTAMQKGEYGTAYERLTSAQAQCLWALVQPHTHSLYLTDGWRISRLLPREERRDVREAEAVRADDDTLSWRPYDTESNRVLAHDIYGDLDGFVYFANRLRVPVAGTWTLCVGHDGGCRVFLNGKEVLCEPNQLNPIREDRTKSKITLTEGDHDMIVALDTNHGLGWGFTMRFEAPPDATSLLLDFPAPVMISQ